MEDGEMMGEGRGWRNGGEVILWLIVPINYLSLSAHFFSPACPSKAPPLRVSLLHCTQEAISRWGHGPTHSSPFLGETRGAHRKRLDNDERIQHPVYAIYNIHISIHTNIALAYQAMKLLHSAAAMVFCVRFMITFNQCQKSWIDFLGK